MHKKETVLSILADFKAISDSVRILEAEVAVLVLDHRDCLPCATVRIGFGDEAEMLQLDDELFLRLHKGGFFHHVGGGNAVVHVAERVNLFDGRFTQRMEKVLRRLAEHECPAYAALERRRAS